MTPTEWERLFTTWSAGPSQADQERTERAVQEIGAALKAHPGLSARNIEVFAQGSFRNRVNVRKESDVDVCCLCDSTFFYELPPNRSPAEFSITPATYGYSEYKSQVGQALVARFGAASVSRGNKAFDVHEIRRLLDADVVATFEFRDYTSGYLIKGTALISDREGRLHTNFPVQQYDNGVTKHAETSRAFKRQVRIQKTLRNKMSDEGKTSARPITSFLLESLCWNSPIFCYANSTYYSDFEAVLRWLHPKLASPSEASDLREVNGVKRLFGSHNAWTINEVRSYIEAAWGYTH